MINVVRMNCNDGIYTNIRKWVGLIVYVLRREAGNQPVLWLRFF